ncbi:MAG: DUF1592 domain-containing protein, partial [Myxococcales bacterium]
MATEDKRKALVPCVPAGADDAACMRAFVEQFGRRALRRTLTSAEIDAFASLQTFGVEAGNFYKGVELAIAAMLQHPSFLYLVELGRPVEGKPDTFRLQPFEVAARLSYFLWGTTPDDTLLDAAQHGGLDTAEQVRAHAERMLQDPRAEKRIERFHALWLGYHQLPHAPELVDAMQAETNALVRKAVQPGADYFELFKAEETYVTDALAQHYGLSKPPGPAAWIGYGATKRKGILSHGAVLSAFAKKGDTSPTQRGLFIRERLLCQKIPPPPPEVNADDTPESELGPCKEQRYSAHASVGSCKACHAMMDPIGFGLENYDKAGRFRTH